jgi:tRNA A-37 threonylcarbamoyl transferase component Bud32
MESKH